MKSKLLWYDCVLGLADPKIVPEESVDVVVTSPPYNIGVTYPSYRDKRPVAEYIQWCEKWASQLYHVLKEDGSFFLNLGASLTAPTLPLHVICALTDWGWHLQNTFHWVKSITVGDTSTGHFKPVNSTRFVNDCHEYVFHLTKHGYVALDRKAIGVPYQDKSNIKRWGHANNADVRCRGNVWFIPYKTVTTAKLHPATFPIELPEMCIRLHGAERAKVVLDPFMGLGHTGMAAARCGAEQFIGFDVDANYVQQADQLLGN
jgi:site-specific DNA-methyltransferase (adenine-specific)